MADDTVTKYNEILTQADVVCICQALKKHILRVLCLRECVIEASDLQRILKYIGSCQSLLQLTLNVGIIKLPKQIENLSACITRNRFLTALHLHGSNLGDDGFKLLGKAILIHPGIVSLDVGDCHLGDMAVDVLYDLLLPETNRSGLTDLTLSANPRITAQGWAQFAMAVANCASLKVLLLDYNCLGDYSASCILVAVAAAQNMEILDLEGCGLTEHTGQLILHLVQNHLGGLSKIPLKGNKIKKSTMDAIKTYLRENNMDTESESSTLDLDLTISSTTSDTESKSSSSSHKVTSHSPASSSDSTESEESDSEKASTVKSSSSSQSRILSDKEKGKTKENEKEEDDDDDSLGEELMEVPVYYA